MDNGSAGGQLQEIVAEVDHEISSGQPLSQELPRITDPPSCSNTSPMPASNMAASDREQSAPAAPRKKRRGKQARANVAPANPFTIGSHYSLHRPIWFLVWSGPALPDVLPASSSYAGTGSWVGFMV